MEETKLCSKCGKKMIQVSTGTCLTSYPAQYPWNWWCGGCDLYEEGGTRREKVLNLKDLWEAENA